MSRESNAMSSSASTASDAAGNAGALMTRTGSSARVAFIAPRAGSVSSPTAPPPLRELHGQAASPRSQPSTSAGLFQPKDDADGGGLKHVTGVASSVVSGSMFSSNESSTLHNCLSNSARSSPPTTQSSLHCPPLMPGTARTTSISASSATRKDSMVSDSGAESGLGGRDGAVNRDVPRHSIWTETSLATGDENDAESRVTGTDAEMQQSTTSLQSSAAATPQLAAQPDPPSGSGEAAPQARDAFALPDAVTSAAEVVDLGALPTIIAKRTEAASIDQRKSDHSSSQTATMHLSSRSQNSGIALAAIESRSSDAVVSEAAPAPIELRSLTATEFEAIVRSERHVGSTSTTIDCSLVAKPPPSTAVAAGAVEGNGVPFGPPSLADTLARESIPIRELIRRIHRNAADSAAAAEKQETARGSFRVLVPRTLSVHAGLTSAAAPPGVSFVESAPLLKTVLSDGAFTIGDGESTPHLGHSQSGSANTDDAGTPSSKPRSRTSSMFDPRARRASRRRSSASEVSASGEPRDDFGAVGATHVTSAVSFPAAAPHEDDCDGVIDGEAQLAVMPSQMFRLYGRDLTLPQFGSSALLGRVPHLRSSTTRSGTATATASAASVDTGDLHGFVDRHAAETALSGRSARRLRAACVTARDDAPLIPLAPLVPSASGSPYVRSARSSATGGSIFDAPYGFGGRLLFSEETSLSSAAAVPINGRLQPQQQQQQQDSATSSMNSANSTDPKPQQGPAATVPPGDGGNLAACLSPGSSFSDFSSSGQVGSDSSGSKAGRERVHFPSFMQLPRFGDDDAAISSAATAVDSRASPFMTPMSQRSPAESHVGERVLIGIAPLSLRVVVPPSLQAAGAPTSYNYVAPPPQPSLPPPPLENALQSPGVQWALNVAAELRQRRVRGMSGVGMQ